MKIRWKKWAFIIFFGISLPLIALPIARKEIQVADVFEKLKAPEVHLLTHKSVGIKENEFLVSTDRAQKSQEKIADSLGFKVMDNEGHITYDDNYKPYDLTGIELVVVPHGLTDGDVEGVLQVSKDVDDPRFELNAEGHRQVAEGAKIIWAKYADRINAGQASFYRSSTKRTAQTANAFIHYANSIQQGIILEIKISDAIRMNLGAWEGTTKAQIDTVLPSDEKSRAKKFIQKNALIGPKNGQSFVEYLAVVRDFLDTLKRKNNGRTVIIFGHGIFIKALKVLLRTNDIIDSPYLDWDSGTCSSYKLGMPLVMNDIPRKGQGATNGISAWRKENTRSHSIEELAAYAANARAEGLRIWRKLKGPLAGTMSSVDLYTVLFMDYVDRKKFISRHPKRLRIAPKGTAGSTLYSTAAYAGLVEADRVININKNDLEIIPTRFGLSDVSLYKMGTSFEQAIGLALASKIKQIDYPVLVFLTDGGLQLGVDHQAKFAAHMGLNNLTVVVDINRLQNAYRVEDVDPTLTIDQNGHLSRMMALWEAYGWDVVEIDGHDFQQIRSAYDRIGKGQKPLIILAKTVKGRGMSEIEGRLSYSHKFPSENDYQVALKSLQGTVYEYHLAGQNIKYPEWTPVQRMTFDNQGFALPRHELTIDDLPVQIERPLADQEKQYLENILRIWLKEFIAINPNKVFIINTDNPSPFEIGTPIMSPTNLSSPFIFAGINERFALNLAGGLFLEGLATIYMGPAAHMPVNAEDWKMLGLGKQNVLVIARSSGSALSYWGPGHLVYEDVELFKNPWAQVLQPAHAQDLKIILENYYRMFPQGKPTYLRMQEVLPFDLSSTLFDSEEKSTKIFKDGFYLTDSFDGQTEPVVFVVSGKTVKEAMDAGQELRRAGVSYKIVNIINLSSINKKEFQRLVVGASKIITAIDALPQSLSSIVYDAIPDLRAKVVAFGVRDGGSFKSESEIFAENKMDTRSLIAFAIKEGLIKEISHKTLSKLPVSDENELVRQSWEEVLHEENNAFINNLVKLSGVMDKLSFEKLITIIVGLGVDVSNVWHMHYLVYDLLSDCGPRLLGEDTSGFKTMVVDYEIHDLELHDYEGSKAIPEFRESMSLAELRGAVRDFKGQQRNIVLSRVDYQAISNSVHYRNIQFMQKLLRVLIPKIWQELGINGHEPTILYVADMKTAASDLDVVYVGPEKYKVDQRLTELCFLLGINRDMGAVVLINSALKEGLGREFSGYQYGGNIAPIVFNGAKFDDFYHNSLKLKNPQAALQMYVSRIQQKLLIDWLKDYQGGKVQLGHLKTVYTAGVNDLLKAFALKFNLSYGFHDDAFWEKLGNHLEPEDLSFLKKFHSLVHQTRSLVQFITNRRWDVSDDLVVESVTQALKEQGVKDFQNEILLAGSKIKRIVERYFSQDGLASEAAKYKGREDKDWDSIATLYENMAKSRLGSF